jgi:methyltransferase
VSVFHAALALVAAQRLAELAWARHNTARLRRAGAVEADAAGYPLFILLHAAWLASLLLIVPGDAQPSWPLLGLFALLQPARLWVVVSLGRWWTTRILTLPGAPLVHRGPYRWLCHPNYAVVTAEMALLPLAFGGVAIAGIFSVLNLLLIARRIAIEDGVLTPRRAL